MASSRPERSPGTFLLWKSALSIRVLSCEQCRPLRKFARSRRAKYKLRRNRNPELCSSRHQHGVVEIQDDRGVVFAFSILIGEVRARPVLGSDGSQAQRTNVRAVGQRHLVKDL